MKKAQLKSWVFLFLRLEYSRFLGSKFECIEIARVCHQLDSGTPSMMKGCCELSINAFLEFGLIWSAFDRLCDTHFAIAHTLMDARNLSLLPVTTGI